MKKPRLPKEEFKDSSLQHGIRMGYTVLSGFQKLDGMELDKDETVIAYLLADIQEYCERVKLDFPSLVVKAGAYVDADNE